MNRPRQPMPYLEDVINQAFEALASGTLQPGQVYNTLVFHDAWCDLLSDKGPCSCEPDVQILPLVPPDLN